MSEASSTVLEPSEFGVAYPDVLTMGQVAEILQISMPTVYEVARRPDFPVFRVGRKLLVRKEGLRLWMESQEKRDKSLA
ncbi:helix-turn-helix domain-containing protein [Alicyclobacillus acidoterrestris]|uniref:helix-turn-helix domain-containing protein n=1 Tax=Alicyclobacillus acidoterrestris TaxID=1450 RepID=UPI003F529642